MSDNYEQPVEPMSRAEDILRGNTSTVPMSRIEALLKQIIEGGGEGSTVTISTDYQAGTKIATLTIDGTDYNIYIPTDQIGSIVSISTDYQAGTKIATLTIDNTPYNIYIPEPIDVEANPSDPATATLSTIKIGDTVYSLPSGGSSDVFTLFTVPTGINGTSNIEETEEE